MMACEPAVMDQEIAFLGTLQAAESVQLQDERLTIRSEDGQVLIFGPAEIDVESVIEMSELTGILWVLEGFSGEEGLMPAMEGTEITLEFDDEESQVGGSAGCNTFFGSFQTEGDQLSFGPLGATRMACEPAVMDQETVFLDALQATESAQIDGGQLLIKTQDGQTLVFVVGETAKTVIESEIVGVIWEWERFIDTAGINNITVPYPSSYRLELHPDGRFDLKADCNLASGNYTLESSSLSLEFGPMTLAECEQGSLYNDYLSRLEYVVTFVHQDDQLYLNMWADGGDLVFRRLHAVTGRIVAPGLDEAAEVEVRVVDTAGVKVGGLLAAAPQFPYDFEATYYPPSIQPDETYSLDVSVRDENGDVIYSNVQAYPVITQDYPIYHLEVQVEPVSE
jgi:heat shock protein HslJ